MATPEKVNEVIGDTGLVVTASLGGGAEKASDQTGGQFGWLWFKPKWLQCVNTPNWYTAFFCAVALTETFAVLGLTGVVLPTVERRYRLSSTQSGLIISSFDIAAAIGVIPVSYYGDRAHKPRWIGFGSLLVGLGSFVFALPQFISGSFRASGEQRLEYCGVGLNHSVYALSDCGDEQRLAYSLLILGQILMAWGALPIFTLGITFIDEIFPSRLVHTHLAALYLCSAIGTALGFILGSQFLSQYVDLNAKNIPDELDPSFVGRWWAGYLLCTAMAIVSAIPMFGYPRVLPGTEWIMEEKRSKQRGLGACSRPKKEKGSATKREHVGVRERLALFKTHCKKVAHLCWSMLLTGAFVCNILGASNEATLVSGVGPFFTKFIQTQFRTTASSASLTTGAMIIPAVGGGVLFGAWILKKRDVHSVRLAKYTFVISCISLLFSPALIVHCGKPTIVGVTVTYPNSSLKSADRCKQPLNSSCMASCGCVSQRYDPVCGSDGRTYLTPCLAGCHNYPPGSSTNDRVYYNCTCIAEDDDNFSGLVYGTGKTGFCTSDGCNLQPLFVVLGFLLMFFTLMNVIPAIEVIIQSVPAEHRTLATGVQWITIRLLANAPSPVLFGYLLDQSCVLWELKCCKRGNCWEYDTPLMSITLFSTFFCFKLLAVIFYFLSWRFYVRDKPKRTESNDCGLPTTPTANGKKASLSADTLVIH